jgi:hypothetical protein
MNAAAERGGPGHRACGLSSGLRNLACDVRNEASWACGQRTRALRNRLQGLALPRRRDTPDLTLALETHRAPLSQAFCGPEPNFKLTAPNCAPMELRPRWLVEFTLHTLRYELGRAIEGWIPD